ncbi:zinc ABC transporter substrate-binding protein [Aquisalimonas lutea]|uniref:zinc ABC transporter substrate-binding protein n=1 Tax=Aquisalimonas lutea TaxID=1327750 RepID=UPI0025B2C3BD|nr:zinc ABC transporter substrate-binding protein [Aquisalimonas lutea]MDN3518804.1 zinc ABC transporter substrate-binding protein [Aquisalimonas lutea]
MTFRIRHYAMALLLAPAVVAGEVPSVAVDIPPVHSLVDRVMGDLGSPDLVIQPGASPHGYSMRPSEAAALDRAGIVFWVSEDLTPWLKRSIDTLAGDAVSVQLMDVPGTLRLDYREGATLDSREDAHDDHDHGHEHDQGHQHSHGHDHGHAHHGEDPHGWLDPANAQVWLDAIAESLADADPGNAATYRDNARLAREELEDLTDELDERLAKARGARFVVFHDAYQYFENRFGLSAAGAIALGDASDPSPARIDALRQRVEQLDVDCVFSEPQFNPALIDSVFGDTGVDTSIVVDPLGVDLPLGGRLYGALLQRLAEGVTSCAQGR